MNTFDKTDALIIGCGFAGAVIARELAEAGKKTLILERREHIAGNMFDFMDENGILLHKYGPHSFHTNDGAVIRYLERFGRWIDYKLRCTVYMEGKFTPSPFNFKTIDQFFPERAEDIKKAVFEEYPGAEKASVVDMLECGNETVREYAKFLFEKDYAPYTAKQWGISPDEIDLSVLRRVPILFSYKEAYFDDEYQKVPERGYTELFKGILAHENIELRLNTDAADFLSADPGNGQIFIGGEKAVIPVVYTGEIDALFEYRAGRLPYRSLRFDWQTHEKDSFQDAAITAYPQEDGFTRITEYKKLPPQDVAGMTTVAVEYPVQYEQGKTAEPYYPIPTNETARSYADYAKLAGNIPNLYLCGRLSEYKYYNMDEVVKRALEVSGRILAEWGRGV